MSIPKSDKWIKVEWNSGGQSVVNVRYLLKSLPRDKELKIGTVVTIGKQENGDPLTATVLASAPVRVRVDDVPIEEIREPNAGTSAQNEPEQADFSPSASDWEPNGESSSEDTDEEVKGSKKIKIERTTRQYCNKTSRKILTPTHRPKAIIPNCMQQQALQHLMNTRKTNIQYGKTLPDSTKINKPFDAQESSNEHVNGMKALFEDLFKILSRVSPIYRPTNNSELFKNEPNNTNYNENVCDGMDNEDWDRSDDNVLISNRYDTIDKTNGKAGKNEWVPIGSGTTLIHREKFRKVNWKSYTVATRTLLLAAFSRKILATHSLTGKKSPAFTNKPAKMCLDPKVVSDIVIEITDKFRVKENLVRSIITTKCADECKMSKMQKNRLNASNNKNQENIPPAAIRRTTNSQY